MFYGSFILFAFFVYLLPLAVCYIVVIVWGRVLSLKMWVWANMVLPFPLWLSFILINGTGKTLSNAIIEPFLCGCIACIPIILERGTSRFRCQAKSIPFISFTLTCIFVLLIYFGMPAITE
jgi:hypothetical protein